MRQVYVGILSRMWAKILGFLIVPRDSRGGAGVYILLPNLAYCRFVSAILT